MSVLFWILLIAFITLLLTAAAVVLTAVKLECTLCTTPRLQLNIAARLLGGITPRFYIHSSERRYRKEKFSSKQQHEKPRDSSNQSLQRLTRIIPAVAQLTASMIQNIHLRRLTVNVKIGCADPADTSRLFGLLEAIMYAIPQKSHISVAVQPDFTAAGASARANAELSFIPIFFVKPIARFAWTMYGRRS